MNAFDLNRRSARRYHLARGGALMVALGLVLSACGGASSTSSTGSHKGGNIYFAEGPGANPNYIFPYMGCANFSVSNINQFQNLMYEPLYWFGLGASTAVQYPLSTAKAPVFSNGNATITIDMKGWKFSDGTTIDAKSVMFFMNMYKADPTAYCGYNQGYGIPDELKSASGSGNTLTMTFKHSVSPNFILYNYLSELSPMPNAWDKTSTNATGGTGGCAAGAWGTSSTNAKCIAVEKFLNAQSSLTSTYTNAMWQTVDGPWKLTSFDKLGNAKFVPNKQYSGSPKPYVDAVYLRSYTTTASEESDLYANKLTIGYVDPSVLPGPAISLTQVGPNVPILKGKYNLMTGTPWSTNYAPLNFTSSDPKAAELKQLYIRQALQEAMNQNAIIKSVDRGYGVPSCSPIPPNVPASISANIPCAYPYSVSNAKSLLTSHGWTIRNHVQTCVRPGSAANQCGPGIKAGATLNFAIIWASGTPSLDQTLNAEIAAWQSIGIIFSHSQSSFNNVTSQCSGHTFQLCMWGAGWIYAPDYYPSGESLFVPGASFNVGGYNDPTLTALVKATISQNVNLTAYGQAAAQQLPVLWEPNPTSTVEFSVKLKGIQPLNPLQNFMPQYMHF
jgi:peptide/nickel transport system substrate-binding protein